MYKLVYGSPTNHTILMEGSLQDCAHFRSMSGDLVLGPDGQVSQNCFWLFSWEMRDPSCYARQAQQNWVH